MNDHACPALGANVLLQDGMPCGECGAENPDYKALCQDVWDLAVIQHLNFPDTDSENAKIVRAAFLKLDRKMTEAGIITRPAKQQK